MRGRQDYSFPSKDIVINFSFLTLIGQMLFNTYDRQGVWHMEDIEIGWPNCLNPSFSPESSASWETPQSGQTRMVGHPAHGRHLPSLKKPAPPSRNIHSCLKKGENIGKRERIYSWDVRKSFMALVPLKMTNIVFINPNTRYFWEMAVWTLLFA